MKMQQIDIFLIQDSLSVGKLYDSLIFIRNKLIIRTKTAHEMLMKGNFFGTTIFSKRQKRQRVV